jgi:NOL1/NOP2/sun family putative RNA methylase
MKKLILKPLFVERMKEMLGAEAEEFFDMLQKPLPTIIRANTLKISVDNLKKVLAKKWQIGQPLKELPEALIIQSTLAPGELGKSEEHSKGLFFVQDLASMMPVLVLGPQPGETILDMCAAPGAKTTQIAAMMRDSGTLYANDISRDRLRILKINLKRCDVRDAIVTNLSGRVLGNEFSRKRILFDRILLDAPCSGEGSLRSDIFAAKIWSLKMIKRKAALQRKLINAALQCLKPEGILVYSTCTFAPEENEAIIDHALNNFDIKLEPFVLPIKSRQGMAEWQGKSFNSEVKKCARIWPQDNDSEGFFIAKIRKVH